MQGVAGQWGWRKRVAVAEVATAEHLAEVAVDKLARLIREWPTLAEVVLTAVAFLALGLVLAVAFGISLDQAASVVVLAIWGLALLAAR